MHVASTLGRLARASAGAPEEGVEDVAESSKVLGALEAVARASPASHTQVAEAVVLRPLLGVAERLVGGVDLLELLLRVRVLVPVGMVLQGQAAKLGPYVLLRGVAGNAQNLIVVSLISHNLKSSVQITSLHYIPCPA